MAVVDCTGHGVPGAFMSLIGNRILNEIVNEKKIYNPAQILEFLNVGVQVALKQDETDNNDGMDVCLCRIEYKNGNNTEICFAGAKSPLYYYNKKNNKIERIAGSRKSIGGIRSKRSKVFYETKTVNLKKEDIIYLISDGYIDQNAPDRQKLGSNRFTEILNNIKDKDLNNQKEILENELKTHMQKEEQRDDITIVGIKI